MKKLSLIILIVAAHIAYAMEENEQVPTISIGSSEALYIGNCTERTTLEAAYGDKFPFNTIFLGVNFKNVVLPQTWSEKFFGAYGYKNSLPEFIPYQFVKDGAEDNWARIELYGTSYSILCKQKGSKSYGLSHFESIVDTAHNNFIRKPKYLKNSEQSLVDAKIIRLVNGLCLHDQNCAPEARKKI